MKMMMQFWVDYKKGNGYEKEGTEGEWDLHRLHLPVGVNPNLPAPAAKGEGGGEKRKTPAMSDCCLSCLRTDTEREYGRCKGGCAPKPAATVEEQSKRIDTLHFLLHEQNVRHSARLSTLETDMGVVNRAMQLEMESKPGTGEAGISFASEMAKKLPTYDPAWNTELHNRWLAAVKVVHDNIRVGGKAVRNEGY